MRFRSGGKDNRDWTDVVTEILRQAGITLPGSGPNYALSCPIKASHRNGDAKPSASINPRMGGWRCFKCGAHGGVKKLATLLGVDWGAVIRSSRKASVVRAAQQIPAVSRWPRHERGLAESEIACMYAAETDWGFAVAFCYGNYTGDTANDSTPLCRALRRMA
jgi:hypothetical protein